jgi:hypothetical protein
MRGGGAGRRQEYESNKEDIARFAFDIGSCVQDSLQQPFIPSMQNCTEWGLSCERGCKLCCLTDVNFLQTRETTRSPSSSGTIRKPAPKQGGRYNEDFCMNS